MNNWSTDRILAAFTSFDEEPLPIDVIEVRTSDYRLLCYPERLLSPTFPAVQVAWSTTSRPVEDLFEEISQQVQVWGFDAVHWWVTPLTRPLETEVLLRTRGGELTDSVQLLALELVSDTDTNTTTNGINVQLVCDERTFRDSAFVATRGWGRSSQDEDVVVRRFAEVLSNLESLSGFRFVAYVDGKPASTGSFTMFNDIARLYGAVTLPEFRGRGCYRAVLARRLNRAQESGATLALTRGRPATSGTILIRAGFTVYGEERCYCLAVR
jgi:GNAT superfamily N-acetyltransferase